MTTLDSKNVLDATTVAVTGNEAVAEAMRQIDPDVVCAYPITPQTEIVADLRPVRRRRQGRQRVRHRRVASTRR